MQFIFFSFFHFTVKGDSCWLLDGRKLQDWSRNLLQSIWFWEVYLHVFKFHSNTLLL